MTCIIFFWLWITNIVVMSALVYLISMDQHILSMIYVCLEQYIFCFFLLFLCWFGICGLFCWFAEIFYQCVYEYVFLLIELYILVLVYFLFLIFFVVHKGLFVVCFLWKFCIIHMFSFWKKITNFALCYIYDVIVPKFKLSTKHPKKHHNT